MSYDKKVLLTGGTGFVGHWMRMTVPENILLSAIDKMRYESGQWRWNKYDYIVHLANVSPEAVLETGSKILYCSSGAVYEGKDEYAYRKRRWERMCIGKATIARLFTFSGERLRYKSALRNFIDNAKMGLPLEVWGDGSTVRSYLYGEDLGRWMWKILFEGTGVYDVGSEKPYTIKRVAKMVAKTADVPIDFIGGCVQTYYMPDTRRAKKLGCVETVNLQTAIERMLK